MSNHRSRQTERGVALIIALLALLVLSSLGASIIFLSQTETWTNVNFKLATQTRYTAEAGLQNALNWFIYSYTQPTSANYSSFTMTANPVTFGGSAVVLSAMAGTTSNYPTASVQTAFNSALNSQAVSGLGMTATYSVKAELLSMRVVNIVGGDTAPVQLWKVTSRGDIDAARDAQVELTANLERLTQATFTYAAFGVDASCSSVNLSGGAVTDSFDSSLGTYASTATASGGDVGSNGNIRLDGSSTDVNGTVASPISTTGSCASGAVTALSTTGGATYSSTTTLPAPVSFSTPSAPSPLPGTGTYSTTSMNECGAGANAIPAGCTPAPPGVASLAPLSGSTPTYANITINGTVMHLSAGTYIFNSLTLSGGAQLVIDSGPVIVKLAGQSLSGANPKVLDMAGGAVITNALNSADDLQIVYAGTANVEMNGGAQSYGVVYAPNANIVMHGNSDWFGSLIGKTVDGSGGIKIHYDRSLRDDFYSVGNFRPLFFSWSKF